MRDVECPCCHGKIYIEIVREDVPGSPIWIERCGYCVGTGKIEAEEFYLLNGLWSHDEPKTNQAP
jgi:DnaJ-class molecular chaperone